MTAPKFYDSAGNYHHHDPNIHTTSYRCSNGHSWTFRQKHICPSCDYNAKASAEGEAG